jgi:hypothetical protein
MWSTDYMSDAEYASIKEDCGEVARLLISIVKTSRTHN